MLGEPPELRLFSAPLDVRARDGIQRRRAFERTRTRTQTQTRRGLGDAAASALCVCIHRDRRALIGIRSGRESGTAVRRVLGIVRAILPERLPAGVALVAAVEVAPAQQRAHVGFVVVVAHHPRELGVAIRDGAVPPGDANRPVGGADHLAHPRQRLGVRRNERLLANRTRRAVLARRRRSSRLGFAIRSRRLFLHGRRVGRLLVLALSRALVVFVLLILVVAL